jgi:hypothetical protein
VLHLRKFCKKCPMWVCRAFQRPPPLCAEQNDDPEPRVTAAPAEPVIPAFTADTTAEEMYPGRGMEDNAATDPHERDGGSAGAWEEESGEEEEEEEDE